MEAIIYFFIFITGTLFGSFFTLAVYRIPIKESIMYGRSYCPKCNHKLSFFDLIPILSYICLGGKCRYCKEKIRVRYILLEILSGITFLLFAMSIKINIYDMQIQKIVYLVFGMLFIATLFIIGGIEKEKHDISIAVILFGLIIELIYIVYLYILGISIYKYVIYIPLVIILMLINKRSLKKKGNQLYPIKILILCLYIVIFLREELVIISIILTLLLITIKQTLISRADNKKEISEEQKNIPIGFYLCVTNVIMIVLQSYLI